MTSDTTRGRSSSDDWTLVNEENKKSDDNQSDIEVISNPSNSNTDHTMTSPDPPRLLYSDILKKEPIIPFASESDIEFVPDPDSPQLEYDDEQYLDEILKSTRVTTESEPDDDEDCKASDDERLPYNASEVKPAMTMSDVENKEVVLEINLTLLSFSIILGFSGMSGFFLGGIYSAVLTNNISPPTALMTYPGVLPGHFYRDDITKSTCSSNVSCQPKLYRIEENMKYLKQTLSHDIKHCHKKLKTAVKENVELHQSLSETTHTRTKKCRDFKVQIAKIQSESVNLLSELENQRSAVNHLRHHSDAEAARRAITITSLKQMLENSRSDLLKARGSVSVLDELNTECRKSSILSGYVQNQAVAAAKQHSHDSNFWKNLYKHAILDLEEAEQRIYDLEESIAKESNILKNSQVEHSNIKIDYLKERNAKNYYKNLSQKYSNLLAKLDKKYVDAKAEQMRLGEEFETLKVLTDEMESNLESCSNESVMAVERAENAVHSKQYVESILMSKISNDKEEFTTLKKVYRNQKKAMAEMESQREYLEETLVRKITTNRQKFQDAKLNLEKIINDFGESKKDTSRKVDILKSKFGKTKNDKFAVKLELEKSRVVIAEFQEQFEQFESYTRQIETHLIQLREDIITREAIQGQYIASKEREHKAVVAELTNRYETLLKSHNSTSSDLNRKYGELKVKLESTADALDKRTAAFEGLKRRYDEVADTVEDESDLTEYWKDSYIEAKSGLDNAVKDLSSCRHGKKTAITEYKKTTNLLLDLLQDAAAKPKVLQLLKVPYLPDNSTQLDTCLADLSPLFPGVPSETLLGVMNMTQSKSRGSKMSTALEKFWGVVDKTYHNLVVKEQEDEDEEDWFLRRHSSPKREDYPQRPRPFQENDWYLKRKPLTGKGEYSFVNKKKSQNEKHSKSSMKGQFDCRKFDCLNSYPTHFAFDLCGC